MAQTEWVSVEGVVAVSDGLVLTCEVNGRRVAVPLGRVAPHSQVRRFGDRGRLVIDRQLAFDLFGLAGQSDRIERHRILVVEDHDETREAICELVRFWEHDIQTARAGEDALAIARAWRPDVVVLDIHLPDIDGYVVARRLRMLPGNERLTIIVVSGDGRPEDVQRAMAAGVDAHLLKPFDPDRLRAMIEAGGDLRVHARCGR